MLCQSANETASSRVIPWAWQSSRSPHAKNVARIRSFPVIELALSESRSLERQIVLTALVHKGKCMQNGVIRMNRIFRFGLAFVSSACG